MTVHRNCTNTILICFGQEESICKIDNIRIINKFTNSEQVAEDIVGRTYLPDGEGRYQDLPQAACLRATGTEEDHGLQRDALDGGGRQQRRGSLNADQPEQSQAAMNFLPKFQTDGSGHQLQMMTPYVLGIRHLGFNPSPINMDLIYECPPS